MDAERDRVRKRATGAVLRNAVMSWQVAFTLVFTAVLFLFVPLTAIGLESWVWLIGGTLAAGGFITATLSDPAAAQEAVSKEFERQFDISRIRNRKARQSLQDAFQYRTNMLDLARQAKGALRTSLHATVDDIDDWIAHMYSLALHIDSFNGNDLVRRDREMVPEQIRKTKDRIAKEKDPVVLQDLQRSLETLEQQRINLDEAFNGAKRAEIQLESTLSSLGTIYAQMTRLGNKEVDGGRAQRLRLEIQDEVAQLQDTIDAMDEVHQQTLRLR